MDDPIVKAANAVAHLGQRRYDEPVTPLDYWRSWSWLERAVMVAAGASLALGGWVIVALAVVLGSPS